MTKQGCRWESGSKDSHNRTKAYYEFGELSRLNELQRDLREWSFTCLPSLSKLGVHVPSNDGGNRTVAAGRTGRTMKWSPGVPCRNGSG